MAVVGSHLSGFVFGVVVVVVVRLKAAGGAGKRKKAAASGKPKRPPSAFFVFMSEFRQEYQAAHPDNKSVAAVSFLTPSSFSPLFG